MDRFKQTDLQLVTMKGNKIELKDYMDQLLELQIHRKVIVDEKQNKIMQNMVQKSTGNQLEDIETQLRENMNKIEQLYGQRTVLLQKQMQLIKGREITEEIEEGGLVKEYQNLKLL